MPLFSEHINNMYYSGSSPSYSAPYSYTSSVLPLGSSYSASYLNPGGTYSNHSSLGGYGRAPLSSRWMSGGRNYSPILGTITERGTSSPVRINSPRRIHIPKRNYVPTSYTSRPININTADIDVSKDKYRSKTEPTPKPQKDLSPEKDNGPFMPRVDGKPETGVDSSPGVKRSTIQRGRTVVRLHTIKRKDRDSPRKPTVTSDSPPEDESNENENIIIDEPTESLGWRERLSEDLTYIDKREKKSLGTKLVEKFIVKDKDDDLVPIRERNVAKKSEILQTLPVSPLSRRKSSLSKSPDRRCSIEMLSEQADLLDSLIRSENLSVATLDLTKVGLTDENENSQLTSLAKRRKSNDGNNPLQSTKSDHSLHESLKCKDFKDPNHFNKVRSIQKSSSGGSIRRLDSISEFPRETVNSNLPAIEENRQSVKRNSVKAKPKPKIKQKITTSVEISEPEPRSPLKFIVENVTVEEKLTIPKKEFTFSAEVIELPVKTEAVLNNELNKTRLSPGKPGKSLKNKKRIKQNLSIPEVDESASPEPDDGNFWEKIGKRETVYLMKRKQFIDEQKQKHRRALYWFPEDEESGENEENDNKINNDFNKENDSEMDKEAEIKNDELSCTTLLGTLDPINKVNSSSVEKDKIKTTTTTAKKLTLTDNDKEAVSEPSLSLIKDGINKTTSPVVTEKVHLNDCKPKYNTDSENISPLKNEEETILKTDHKIRIDVVDIKKTMIAEETNNNNMPKLEQTYPNNVSSQSRNSNITTENVTNIQKDDIKNNKDNNDIESPSIADITTLNKQSSLEKKAANKDTEVTKISKPLIKKSSKEEKLRNSELGNKDINKSSLDEKLAKTTNEKVDKSSDALGMKTSREEKQSIEESLKNCTTLDEKDSPNKIGENKPIEEKSAFAKPLIKKSSKGEKVQNAAEETKVSTPLVKKSSLEKKLTSTEEAKKIFEPLNKKSSGEKKMQIIEKSNKNTTLSDEKDNLNKIGENEQTEEICAISKSLNKEVNKSSLDEKLTNTTTQEVKKYPELLNKKLSGEKWIQSTEEGSKINTLVKKSSLKDNVVNEPKEDISEISKPLIKKPSSEEKVLKPEQSNKIVIPLDIKINNNETLEKTEFCNNPQSSPKNKQEKNVATKVANESKTRNEEDRQKIENSLNTKPKEIVNIETDLKIDKTSENNEKLLEKEKPSNLPTIPIVTESENIPNNSKDELIKETAFKTNEKGEEKKAEDKTSKEEKAMEVKLPIPIKKPVKDEPASRPLIATPRPLQKKVPQIIHSSSSSEEESSEEEDDSEESESSEESTEFFECENNPDGRTSTGSNDSGFDSSVPTSPAGFTYIKKGGESPGPSGAASAHTHATDVVEQELEQSTAYGLFRKTGRFTPPARSIPRFRKYNIEDFNFIKVLGKGSFGKVLLAELRDTEYYYAVKCLKKDVVLEDDDVECTLIERKVLALGTNHPYLCHLFATFQTDSHLFFVMEYLNGGDLMFHIQQSGRFPEMRARFYGAEIVSGLKFLHKRGIVYRDLKLDNILLDFDGHVRIADFGMCKLQIYLDKTADTFCGTPDYMAPEIIKGLKYNQTVDWWSFGVLLYEMLIGQSPFSGCDEDELFWSICNEMPSYPRFLSPEALSILTRLLDKDARTRLGGVECMHGDVRDQPFFSQIQWDRLERRDLDAPFKPRVRHPMDTQYFDKVFTGERPRLTAVEPHVLRTMDQEAFRGFSYTNPNATDR